MYEVLKIFSSVKVVCKRCGSVINMSGSVIVVCEYIGSVVDVYGDKLKE